MTEQEWLTESRRAQWMISQPRHHGTFARTKAGKRKLLLCAVGGCRLMWDLLWDDRLRAAVEVAERYADAQASDDERAEAIRAASSLARGPFSPDSPQARRGSLGFLAYCTVGMKPGDAAYAMTTMPLPLAGLDAPAEVNVARLCDLIREVFGNFINPSVAEKHWPRWNDRTLPRMAQAIYDEKAWERLPVLADALEDAGCSDSFLLTHLRSPGPHFRGCWAVDLLMGKR